MLHDFISSILCSRCKVLNICPRSDEDSLAESLAAQALLYHEAIVRRRRNLTAADHFYRDLMVYQWRLNALEVQVRAVNAAIQCSETEPDVELAPDADGAPLPVSSVLGDCLSELEQQQAIAVAAFNERASHYALGAPSDTGCLKRFAASKLERQAAINSYHGLATDTFSEVMREARAFAQVNPQKQVLQQLLVTLERRVAFWQNQLEETWAAWHDVTAEMHRSGDDVMAIWKKMIRDLKVVCHLTTQKPTQSLKRALIGFTARGLNVELINSVGLRGLSSDKGGTEGQCGPDYFSLTARVSALLSALKLLRQEGLLHEVGAEVAKQLLHEDIEGAMGEAEMATHCTVQPSSDAKDSKLSHAQLEDVPLHKAIAKQVTPTTPTPADALHFAAAASRMSPKSIVHLASESERNLKQESEGIACLIAWLTECFVLAASNAAEHNDSMQLVNLLRLCLALGNVGLTSAVLHAVTQHGKSNKAFKSQFLDTFGTSSESQMKEFCKYIDNTSNQDEFMLAQPPKRSIVEKDV
mmetsp:Transcript_6168/g.11395  ORF Transcript_6168/g.11395 Transcript_6168/m.11395 type:complete len:527 (+) Transcript_6168:50-1630(+)